MNGAFQRSGFGSALTPTPKLFSARVVERLV
jgi:hypothetical protein